TATSQNFRAIQFVRQGQIMAKDLSSADILHGTLAVRRNCKRKFFVMVICPHPKCQPNLLQVIDAANSRRLSRRRRCWQEQADNHECDSEHDEDIPHGEGSCEMMG